MRTIKLIIGWTAVVALLVFVFTNSQAAEVNLLVNSSLRAPVALIVILAAVLGALGANAFKKLFAWARGADR